MSTYRLKCTKKGCKWTSEITTSYPLTGQGARVLICPVCIQKNERSETKAAELGLPVPTPPPGPRKSDNTEEE